MPESPGDLVAIAQRALDENPDAPLMDRAAWATVVACGGSVTNKIQFGDVADLLGVPARDVLQAMLALRERADASPGKSESRASEDHPK